MYLYILDHISESIETVFGLKIHEFFNAVPEQGSGIFWTLDLGSGMEKFGSGINIPDPQHWFFSTVVGDHFNLATSGFRFRIK
jgi:hypothetical protein